MFYLHRYIVDFLGTVRTPNRLLQAVLADAKEEMNLVGCKALGLMNKLITTPFWSLLESDVHILDMSMHYQRLLRFLKNAAKDATEFMTGSHLPFP